MANDSLPASDIINGCQKRVDDPWMVIDVANG